MTGRRMNGSERFMTSRPAAGPAGSAGPLASMRTFPPGVTPIWPFVTTRSPGLTPAATMTRSPCRWPSVTGRSSAVPSSLTT